MYELIHRKDTYRMVNENNKKTNFNIANLEDIDELKDVFQYARSLVIKSQEIADQYENVESLRSSVRYISAVLELTDTDDLNREVIIKSYVEKNKYYLYLKKSYNIDIVTARTANDLTILGVMDKTLSVKDEALFMTCYNETVSYYKQTFFTTAFKNQEYHLEYFMLTLVNMTIQKYLTRKMENFFDIDSYTKRQLKNSFISYGFDYFDILPINYQRRLLKMLNELVISKGTNVDIRKIIDIFANKNLDIYKYILAKLYPIDGDGNHDYDNPYLVFYKTLADGIINYDTDIVINYESVVEKDPLWKVDKDEVLYHKVFDKQTEEFKIESDRMFNTIISKYMSVDVTTDALRDAMKTSYLFNFLYKFERDHKDLQDSDFGFFNRDMSTNKIGIFTAIVGLISLMLKKLGIPDKINFFPNILNDIYGYENIDNNDDIIELLKEIQILLVQHKDELETTRKYSELYKFFRNFNMYGFNSPLSEYDMNTIYNMSSINRNIEIQLSGGIRRYSKDIALNQYLEEEHDLIDKLNYLRVHLLNGQCRSQDVTIFLDLTSCYKKYVLIEGYRTPSTRLEINLSILNHELLRKEIESFLMEVENPKIEDAYKNGDLFEIFRLMVEYTAKHRDEVTKKYNLKTEEELKLFLYTDGQDITYYKELYAFMELFYFPFKDDIKYTEKKYNIQQFMDIFNKNEKVRYQLETFIAESNHYRLYRKYLELFDRKMLTKQDTSLYEGYVYFSEYIKKDNMEFYNWLYGDIDAVGKMTPKERKTFYRDKIFLLAESIDTYLGTDVFSEFPMSGIVDFIIMTIYLLVTVFKSFTIDLIQSDSVLRISDKTFNSIRMFDEITSFEVTEGLRSTIKLQDVFRELLYETEVDTDLISLIREKVKITLYDE